MQRAIALAPERTTQRRRDDTVPFDAPLRSTSRERRRSRSAPWFLLPLLAVVTGVGVAYVGEHATATQDSYVLAGLTQTNTTLQNQDNSLGSQLETLKSTERIIALAQGLGMRPSQQWTAVPLPGSSLASIAASTQQQAAASAAPSSSHH